MKLRKILSLIVITALVMTCIGVIFTPAAYAATNGTTFTENFDNMTLGDTYENTLRSLMADGWYMVTNNGTVNPTSALANYFTQVVNEGGRQCLQITTPGANKSNYKLGLGRKFPGQGDSTHTDGIWEINFKFKPFADGSTKCQFNFGFNTFNTSIDETVAQHNIISAYNNKMYMGYRDYLALYNGSGVPQGRIEGSALALDWYDVHVILNCDDRYYSVELSRNGDLVARRSPISLGANEPIGFFKLSALGMGQATKVYVDDIEIKRASRETLIYEEDFEAFSSVVETSDGMTTGGSTEVLTGHSYFEGCTPWRANDDVGKSYGLETDPDLTSRVVRLGDDDSTSGTTEASGLVYMLAYEKLVDSSTELKRGMVKTSFKFKPSVITSAGASVNAIADYTEDINSASAEVFKLVDNSGTPALLTLNDTPVNLSDSSWYDAELVFDVLNREVTTTVKDNDTSAEIASFSKTINSLDALNGLMFKVDGGSRVLMDDIVIEYYFTQRLTNKIRCDRVVLANINDVMPQAIIPSFTASPSDDAATLSSMTVVSGDGKTLDLSGGYTVVFGTTDYTVTDAPDRYGVAVFKNGNFAGCYEAKSISAGGKYGILVFGIDTVDPGATYTMKNCVKYDSDGGSWIVAE